MQLQQFRVKKRRNNFFLCFTSSDRKNSCRYTQDYPEKKKKIYSHMVSESYNTNKLRQEKKMLRNRNSRKQRKEQQKIFCFIISACFQEET